MDEFFSTIFGDQVGHLRLGFIDRTKPKGKDFNQRFKAYPQDLAEIQEIIETNAHLVDLYYTPFLYKSPSERHTKENVTDLVTHVWADLDGCNPENCLVRPTIAVESSPGRYQALWRLDAPVDKYEAEQLSYRIAYHHAAQGADKSGWDLTQLLRIPGTLNHKPEYLPNKPLVAVLWSEHTLYRPSDFTEYPDASMPPTSGEGGLPDFIEVPEPSPSWYTGILAENRETDTSSKPWRIVQSGFELGFPEGMTLQMLWDCKEFHTKYEGRLGREAERMFVKARNRHPHTDKDCWDAECENKRQEDEPPYCYKHYLLKPKTAESKNNAKSGPRKLKLTKASTIKPRRVKWGWDARMPIGELTLIPGREGIGKSLFLAWLAANLTNGTLPGEFYGTPKAVLYSASEDSWSYTIVPRLMAAGADLDLVYRIEVEEHGKIILPKDTHLIPETAQDANAGALMLDPAVSHVDDDLSVNQSRDLRRALEPLRDSAEKAGIMIAALVHFNKAIDTDILSKIPGARAWAEVARAGIALAEDKDEGHFVASQVKNNLGRLDLPNLTYEIDEEFIDTEDGKASVGRLRWTGETETGAEEILARKPNQKTKEDTNLGAAVASSRIIAVVIETNRPMPLAEIIEAVPDIKAATVRQTLRRGVTNGKLTSPDRGVYAPPE